MKKKAKKAKTEQPGSGLPWEEMEDRLDGLNYFFLIFGRRFLREIPEKDLEEAYREAIDLAAGLERLLLAERREHE